MKIAITICATTKYMYACSAQARRIQSALRHFLKDELHLIFVGDSEKEMNRLRSLYLSLIPNIITHFKRLDEDSKDGKKNYEPPAQLLIGQLRTAAFSIARSLDVDYCWSLDSDVLPSPNSLKCSIQMLEFDDGFYSISTCPYVSQGGGAFLGGRGTPYQPILPDWYDEERKIPKELQTRMDSLKKRGEEMNKKHQESIKVGKGDMKKFMEDRNALGKEFQEVSEQVKACPAMGNVFLMNSKRWRKRGWFDQAYPAIGRGSIVPSDWCGFGCTLMNRRALAEAQFDGYDGRGTEDLYIVWHRWYQADLRINVIAHCPADHVIRNPGKDGYFVLMQAYHEKEGECIDHLRVRPRSWYSFDPGEKHDLANDGIMVPKPTEPKKPEAATVEATKNPTETPSAT